MTSPIDIASELLGRGEVPDQAMLTEFLENGGQRLDPVSTAWCAAFVNASLGKAGIEGTGALNAKSFLDWGQPVDQPQRGDVAVFSRGDPGGWQGHVGFFEGYDESGNIKVLGGNQGDAVSLASYSPDRLLGFRRPGEAGNALADYAPQQAPQDMNALAALMEREPKRPELPELWTGHDPNMFMSRNRFG